MFLVALVVLLTGVIVGLGVYLVTGRANPTPEAQVDTDMNDAGDTNDAGMNDPGMNDPDTDLGVRGSTVRPDASSVPRVGSRPNAPPSTPAPTTFPPTTPPPLTVAPTPGGPGSSLPVMPSGSWVLVVESIPHGEVSRDPASRADGYLRDNISAFVIDTRDHPAMTPGYYAVVLGPFPSEEVARDGCAAEGLELGPGCYARRTS